MNNLEVRTKGTTREAIRQGIKTCTHIHHIYTKNVEGKAYVVGCNISDHYIIGMDTSLQATRGLIVTKTFFHDSKIIKNIITNINWQEDTNNKNTYEMLVKKIYDVYKAAEMENIQKMRVQKNRTIRLSHK